MQKTKNYQMPKYPNKNKQEKTGILKKKLKFNIF